MVPCAAASLVESLRGNAREGVGSGSGSPEGREGMAAGIVSSTLFSPGERVEAASSLSEERVEASETLKLDDTSDDDLCYKSSQEHDDM